MLFHRGETLQGKVIEQIDDQHAILQIKGHHLLVESRFPLSENMEGAFQVETTHPQLILKVVPPDPKNDQPISPWLKQYFSDDLFLKNLSNKLLSLWEMRTNGMPPEVQDTLDHLFTLLDRISFKDSFPLDPNLLKEIITQSGLFFEYKLRHLIETHIKNQCDQIVMKDLKGLMIKLNAQLKSLSSSGGDLGDHAPLLENIVDGLTKILHKIEGYQILNLNASDSQEKIFLLLPLWFQNSLQFVEMNIFLPHHNGNCSEPEGISVLFLLDLPEWGKINIEVKMRGESLYCWFKVSNPDVSRFLSDAFSELKERLNRIGFQSQLNISIEDAEEIAQALLNEIGSEAESLLNITV